MNDDKYERCHRCGTMRQTHPIPECSGFQTEQRNRIEGEWRDAIADAIREGWHDTGFYGRADLAPGWLDGLATITADALLESGVVVLGDAVKAAFDPGELDCDRLGFTCREAFGKEPERWCRACRLRAALTPGAVR